MSDLTRLLQTLQPSPDGESAVRHRTALVDAVNADGTVDLDFDGTIIPSVSVLSGAAASIGSVVQVAAWAGDLLVLGAVGSSGFTLAETVIYTSSGTWTKTDYPGIRAIKVRAQAGGGAGGGSAITAAGQASAAGGGGGGGYTEAFVLVSDLAATEAVTVGAGGTANNGASGGNGADSVFDTISGEVRAVGGTGGITLAASAASGFIPGSAGGSANTGDLDVGGSAGGVGIRLQPSGTGGEGGASHLGGGGAGGANAAGSTGRLYGGGGGGAGSNQSTGAARLGGAGGAGVVVVDIYV